MLKICLGSFATPWFFGPYGNQLYHLITEFMKQEGEVELYYLLFEKTLENRIYTMEEIYEMNFENENKKKNPKYIDFSMLKKVKFLGGIEKLPFHDTILSSNIHSILEHFQIDAFLFLSDLNLIIPDMKLNCRSIVWYPNHFNPIVKHYQNTLPIFSDIVSLCPSDKTLLEETLPNSSAIHYIPHHIAIDDDKLRWKKRSAEFREKHGIPKTTFVALINCGNYEIMNRKSLDTSFMAFRDFQEKYDDVLLFVHAWKLQNLQNSQYKTTNLLLNIHELLESIQIPSSKIRIHEDIVDYDTILEFIAMSDVLVHGSRTEGFGVPILEAQLMNVPVITTAFGAMKDYTYYGISVPYLQKEYIPMAKGQWAVPHVDGIKNALNDIYCKKRDIGDPVATQKEILKITNKETISRSFLDIIRTPFDKVSSKKEEIICTRVHYNSSTNDFDLFYNFDKKCVKSCSKLECSDLKGTWTVFFHDVVPVESMFFLFMENTHDLILLKEKRVKEGIYPSAEMVSTGNLDLSIINFAIRSSFVKHIFTNEFSSIYNQYSIHYILNQCIFHARIALSDNIISTEKNN